MSQEPSRQGSKQANDIRPTMELRDIQRQSQGLGEIPLDRWQWFNQELSGTYLETTQGERLTDACLNELSAFYSLHYGIWSKNTTNRPCGRVHMSPSLIKKFIKQPNVHVTRARIGEKLIGYAVANASPIPRLGLLCWITQLVVDSNHRNKCVAKRLILELSKRYQFSSWGLITSNPYAVRALESVTQRRCDSTHIRKYSELLIGFGQSAIPLIQNASLQIDTEYCVLNSGYCLDLSDIPSMMKNAERDNAPWPLGVIKEGQEWFAFTFSEQPYQSIISSQSDPECDKGDCIAFEALSRMRLDHRHAWHRHTAKEVNLILDALGLAPGMSILDIGCGNGRHTLELSGIGFAVVGMDRISEFISHAQFLADCRMVPNATFLVSDARFFKYKQIFDSAICLYDVLCTFTKMEENEKILKRVVDHLKPGGRILLSVMNKVSTVENALYKAPIEQHIKICDGFQRSNTMQNTGNVFQNKSYVVDPSNGVVTRREVFDLYSGEEFEMYVQDRRYSQKDIVDMCKRHGIHELWSRCVRAGRWEEDLPEDSEQAKEVLFLGEYRK
ncbi:MAG: methyltransferase domain-containing protein [bacterium]|nr:methyltransferase domain-containing protein [bacterium]